MKFKKLISDIQTKKFINKNLASNLEITGISFDSRKIEPGNIFVAVKGENHDGHEYLEEAMQKGAAALVCDNPNISFKIAIPTILAHNSRKTLAHLAAKFYDYPSKKLILVGITGTDGKTTTCEIIYNILSSSSKKVGIISTLGVRMGNESIETGLHTTTPDALEIQKILANMVKNNVEIAIMETSSHGLAQYRVEACDFDIGLLTNLASDHLDYHKTLDEYKKAKAKLLQYVADSKNITGTEKTIILNEDDEHFPYFNKFKADKNIGFGINIKSDFRATNLKTTQNRMEFLVNAENSQYSINSSLLGNHNVQNILAAIAVCRTLDISWEVIKSAIATISSVLGRLEKIDHDKGNFHVFIDFAHTPQALKNVLETVRQFTENHIHVVFGCPGARDKSKREPMGEIAGKFADKIYLTMDDPRHEPVEVIIDQIARGCLKQGKKRDINFFEIPNRTKAIAKAVNSAKSGDTVIACGKAHEKSLAISGKEIPWNEYKVVREALDNKNL